jgi:hypothetical protein
VKHFGKRFWLGHAQLSHQNHTKENDSGGYIKKDVDDDEMHEHHGGKHIRAPKPKIIQCQQRESTAQEYEHGH